MTTIPEVVWVNTKEFRKAMTSLRTRGGAHQRAHDEACRIIGSLQQGHDESNKITNHGESRIKSCVKYDLSNEAHRLVTVHSNHFIYLLYVGDHNEVDRWLKRHRGLEIVCNPNTRKVTVTIVSSGEDSREVPPPAVEAMPEENPPYLSRVKGGDSVLALISRNSLAKAIAAVNDDTEDTNIAELAEECSEIGQDIGNLVLDVLCLAREGKLDQAAARIEVYATAAQPVSEIPEAERSAVHDLTNSEELVVLTGLSEFELKKLLQPSNFQEWMLFPHPEQKAVAHAKFDKPSILTGVSGSGKTCVLLHRARHLAREYPGQKIGVITLNRSLVRLLDNLLSELCEPREKESIEVMAFYDYFKGLVDHFGPEKELENLKSLARGIKDRAQMRHFLGVLERVNPATYAREQDPLNRETVDDAWEIFRNREDAATLFEYVRKALHAHDIWTDSKAYVKEEFSLIRSVVPTHQRNRLYLGLDDRGFPHADGPMKRDGRAIPLTAPVRKHVLDLLLMFEEEMLAGGVSDELTLALALLPHISELRNIPDEFRFRCLLVDEFQDLSTRDLSLLRMLTPIGEPDALFLTGDTIQRVMVKGLSLPGAGLGRVDTTRRAILKNYRNSRNILEAASLLARKYVEAAQDTIDEIEILNPEFAVRETAPPQVIRVNQEEEIIRAWDEARRILNGQGQVPWSVCIVTALDESSHSVDQILASRPGDFPVKADRLTGDYVRHQDTLTVGTMTDVKGFEFSTVIIVGCGKSTLPTPGRPVGEAWRDALRLYVAMTRARDGVVMIYSGEGSPFLEAMREKLNWQSGHEVTPCEDLIKDDRKFQDTQADEPETSKPAKSLTASETNCLEKSPNLDNHPNVAKAVDVVRGETRPRARPTYTPSLHAHVSEQLRKQRIKITRRPY